MGVRLGIDRPRGAHKISTFIRKLGYGIEVVDFINFGTIEEIKIFQKKCNEKT